MSLVSTELDAKLGELEKVRAWSPRLVAKLEALIQSDDHWDLYRVNPVSFAQKRGVDEEEAIDLFLHAAKLGLFQMEWRLICPSCSDTLSSFQSLSTLHNRCFCALCHLDTRVDLDDYIQISFNLSPKVRDLPFHHHESLGFDDYVFRYRLDPKAMVVGLNIPKVEQMRAIKRAADFLAPGQSAEVKVEVTPGVMVVHDFESDRGIMFSVDPGGSQRVDIDFSRKNICAETSVKPGIVTVSLKNGGEQRLAWAAVVMPPDAPQSEVALAPAVTGKRLLNSQTFRNLFRNETIGGSEGIGVRDLTLLFTDLKGSTAMYERIGDMKAFALVQQHFVHLGKSIQAHRGAIVKTIGDAVMASFTNVSDAAAAALDMLKEIEGFNESQGHREILLKVGLHRGSSIAVTLNEKIDYFGQTVNIAARVQGLADAEEICLTEEAFKAPGVAELFKGLKVSQEKAEIKGVSGKMAIRRVSMAAAPLTKSKAKPKIKVKVQPKKKARTVKLKKKVVKAAKKKK